MSIFRPSGHMKAMRSSKSIPGAHLIGGERRSATQSRSARTKFGDQQYIWRVLAGATQQLRYLVLIVDVLLLARGFVDLRV